MIRSLRVAALAVLIGGVSAQRLGPTVVIRSSTTTAFRCACPQVGRCMTSPRIRRRACGSTGTPCTSARRAPSSTLSGPPDRPDRRDPDREPGAGRRRGGGRRASGGRRPCGAASCARPAGHRNLGGSSRTVARRVGLRDYPRAPMPRHARPRPTRLRPRPPEAWLTSPRSALASGSTRARPPARRRCRRGSPRRITLSASISVARTWPAASRT